MGQPEHRHVLEQPKSNPTSELLLHGPLEKLVRQCTEQRRRLQLGRRQEEGQLATRVPARVVEARGPLGIRHRRQVQKRQGRLGRPAGGRARSLGRSPAPVVGAELQEVEQPAVEQPTLLAEGKDIPAKQRQQLVEQAEFPHEQHAAEQPQHAEHEHEHDEPDEPAEALLAAPAADATAAAAAAQQESELDAGRQLAARATGWPARGCNGRTDDGRPGDEQLAAAAAAPAEFPDELSAAGQAVQQQSVHEQQALNGSFRATGFLRRIFTKVEGESSDTGVGHAGRRACCIHFTCMI